MTAYRWLSISTVQYCHRCRCCHHLINCPLPTLHPHTVAFARVLSDLLSFWFSTDSHASHALMSSVIIIPIMFVLFFLSSISILFPLPCNLSLNILTARCINYSLIGLVVCHALVASPPTLGSPRTLRRGVRLITPRYSRSLCLAILVCEP